MQGAPQAADGLGTRLGKGVRRAAPALPLTPRPPYLPRRRRGGLPTGRGAGGRPLPRDAAPARLRRRGRSGRAAVGGAGGANVSRAPSGGRRGGLELPRGAQPSRAGCRRAKGGSFRLSHPAARCWVPWAACLARPGPGSPRGRPAGCLSARLTPSAGVVVWADAGTTPPPSTGLVVGRAPEKVTSPVCGLLVAGGVTSGRQ